MEKLKDLDRIKMLYERGENISSYLRKINSDTISAEDVMISYDFQAGSYVNLYKKNPAQKKYFCDKVAGVVNTLGDLSSILEAGVGEATTLGPLIKELKIFPEDIFGFDLSWSRIKCGRNFMLDLGLPDHNLLVGDLFCAPFKDNSFDLVYTAHSIEPNSGREKEALKELYRITGKYLMLLEPSYEFGCAAARKRMIEQGYITNLYSSAVELGFNIIEHRLFDNTLYPLNPTGLMIIRKNEAEKSRNSPGPCCPVTKTELLHCNGALYSPESMLAYPVIDNIPCLMSRYAVVATKLLE